MMSLNGGRAPGGEPVHPEGRQPPWDWRRAGTLCILIAVLVPRFSIAGETAPARISRAERDRLDRGLRSEEPLFRGDAIAVISYLAPSDWPHFSKRILAMLHDPDPEVRLAAIRWVGKSRSLQGSRDILSMLHDPDPTTRSTTLRCVTALSDSARVRIAIGALSDSSPYVRTSAISVLGDCGKEAKRAIPTLRAFVLEPAESLTDVDRIFGDRASALRLIVQLSGAESIPMLRQAVRLDHFTVRSAAVEALRKLVPGFQLGPGVKEFGGAYPPARPALPDSLLKYAGRHDVYLSLRRTRCMGDCPEYLLEFFGDGAARYLGESNAKYRGRFSGHVPPEQVLGLLQYALTIGFFDMRDKYQAPGVGPNVITTDLPNQYVEIRFADKRKQIEDYSLAPMKLRKLEAYMDAIADSVSWQSRDPDSTGAAGR
jgi:hypothetical protein